STFSVGYGVSGLDENANGRIEIDHAPDGADPENGDNEVVIAISDCGTSGEPQTGEWRIRVTPTVATSGERFHMWL
ncbi:MAG: hypothetical protein GWN71_00800, partial [Gammaproteobacteria bacterium]|nr:hypothetical protein [Gemmatimonadota bacterium]NIU72158.1 hypothetical protein [Gammaproteobacteria bacterium]